MTDPVHRKHKHSALNFPLMYAFTENYCMPISHDEVVHGKKSFIDKMYGEYEDKFREARVALMLLMTYPGKKLLFMGTEYAQFREWDFENSLEWFMLDYPAHRYFRDYTASLNNFYLAHSELWDYDFSPEGFEWIFADEAEKNLVAFRRYNKKRSHITVVLNFSGSTQHISLPALGQGIYECIFDTGNIPLVSKIINISTTQNGHHAELDIPAFSGMILAQKSGTKKIKL